MMNDNNAIERELSWDDTIVKDDAFILLEPGEYDFTVKMYERGRFSGSEKMPPCAQATIHVQINTPQGEVVLKNNIFLHTKTEWALSAFFASIGQKKKGEPLRMNWNMVTGARGRCEIGNRTHEGKTYNEVKRFIPMEDSQQTGGFTPGKF